MEQDKSSAETSEDLTGEQAQETTGGDPIIAAACRIISADKSQFSQELMDLISTLHRHPDMFEIQAGLLQKRFKALKAAGFSEEFAQQIILRFGLKKDLADD